MQDRDGAGDAAAEVEGGGAISAYVQEFHYRSVGVVEAIMDLCSWSMSGCSHDVIFLPTNLPGARHRLLRPVSDLRDLPPDSEDIFLRDKWLKYLRRPQAVEGKIYLTAFFFLYFYYIFLITVIVVVWRTWFSIYLFIFCLDVCFGFVLLYKVL
jgi:hypothetical protein